MWFRTVGDNNVATLKFSNDMMLDDGSLARPDVPRERERLVTIASIPWTTPECWRDRKLIIIRKRGVTVTW